MSNVFSSCIVDKKPKSLSECLRQDYISASLWHWCRLVESIGKIVLWAIVIIGAIIAFAAVSDGAGFMGFITIVVITAVIAFFHYVTYHLIAFCIGAVASIVHNTRITANATLYMAGLEEECESESSGKNKYSNVNSDQPINSYELGYWVCKSCNSKNNPGNQYCKNCGKYK